MRVTDESLIERLDALKREGVIAGWQDGGGFNSGLAKKVPLPALIFPAGGGPATTYYYESDMTVAVTALETFGPALLTGRR